MKIKIKPLVDYNVLLTNTIFSQGLSLFYLLLAEHKVLYIAVKACEKYMADKTFSRAVKIPTASIVSSATRCICSNNRSGKNTHFHNIKQYEERRDNVYE